VKTSNIRFEQVKHLNPITGAPTSVCSAPMWQAVDLQDAAIKILDLLYLRNELSTVRIILTEEEHPEHYYSGW